MRGLSFMELMFVLLILGVILSLALPGYRRQVLAAHRAEATQALHDLHLAQERFRSRQTRYARSLQELGQPALSANGRYRLSVAQSTAEGYVLEADAQGQQAQDHRCSRLRLTQSFGQVTHQGMGASMEQSAGCWPQ
ncbi:type IV pilus assembly protein PilE [Roseateles sp. YR242]|uniref:type IV pilin protein n=1 Tax=Roseateles sp. YR242 TaxID=1855305 RepID=UPI0008B15035|nr:type IV pilin protein [Roseateles sp. YR242]SEL07690.1 type IV pilus assembly protein PilE [Roseateles sp. YR242]